MIVGASAVNMPNRNFKHIFISLFTLAFICLFHYESVRAFYLNPIFQRNLPKCKFLFPPAGWIMFFNVDESYGSCEVYGVKNGRPEFIDPHKILETKAILYDNIHRNVMVSVFSLAQRDFCGFLRRKFPSYDGFLVTATYYPSVVERPMKKLYKMMYACP